VEYDILEPLTGFNVENNSQTPVQQALHLQRRLTEIKHPDHTLITYPNIGHAFYPSSQWSTASGPIEQYVLADLYAWLESHPGLSHSFATTAAFTIGANTSTLNTRTTSPSSSSSKR
jgi:uncharacterized protein